MSVAGRIRVGIETRQLIGRRTGIGNYSFNLLRALTELSPELAFVGFDGLSWQPFDDELRLTAAETIPATPLQGLLATGAGLLGPVVRANVVRSAYRSLQRAVFTGTVRRQSLDLFHALYFQPPADPGIPVLPVIYDLSSVRFPDAHPGERRRWLDRLPKLLAKAPLVQTISEFSRREIGAVYDYPDEQIIVAPPAAASIYTPLGAEPTNRDLKSFGLAPQAYFLVVGTLEPRKNLKTLIVAFAQLTPAERLRAPLVIVGGAGWGNLGWPKQTAALEREGSLKLVGSVADWQLRSLYEGAIALLFPSIYEGFGIPVVEAMSCGTRVVHSANTAMDEITDGLCPRVEALDIESWIRAIRGSIEEGQADEHSRDALILRARTFDWRVSAGRIRAAYRRLLDNEPQAI